MMNEEIIQNYTRQPHPTSFSSPANIRRHYGKKHGWNTIRSSLNNIDTFTLHREYKKPAVRNPFYLYEKRQQIQMDLIDIHHFEKENEGTKFLLAAIDCFTKKGWIRPLKNKTAKTSLEAIKSVLEEMEEQPKAIFFDRGTEFKNVLVTGFLQKKNITIMHPNTEPKAAIVERFNRSIQDILYRYLTQNQTYKYIDILPDLLEIYNERGHRTLKYMSPNDAEKKENQEHVFQCLFDHYTQVYEKKKKPRYKVGDHVRVKIKKTIMTRGYHERFGREQFEIIQVNTRMPIPQYIIKSLDSNEIQKGGFYDNELQLIEGDVYKVEKVLKKRTYRGKKQLFVKWLDFNDSHNQWIAASDVTDTY